MKIFLNNTLLLLVLLMVSAESYSAENPCVMNNGYLNKSFSESTISTAFLEKGKGIGGTGINGDDKGIGGTGIAKELAKNIYVSGTIYAYGSICVNGIRIAYDETTPVSEGKISSHTKELKLGQVVNVEATKISSEGFLRAKSIVIENSVVGIVTKVDKQAGFIKVFSEKVRVSDVSMLNSIRVGAKVKVSGLRDASGEILATNITNNQNIPTGVVVGRLKIADGKAVVGSTPISTNIELSKFNGSKVEVQGDWLETSIKVNSIKAVENRVQDQIVSIEGLVVSKQKNGLLINDKMVSKHLGAANVGDRVIVTGVEDLKGNIKVETFRKIETPKLFSGENTRDSFGANHSAQPQSDQGKDDSLDNKHKANDNESGIEKLNEEESDRSKLSGSRDDDDRSFILEDLKIDNSGRQEKVEKIENVGKEKIERPEKVEKIEKVEKVEKVEKIEKPEKVEKVEKVERPEKVEKPEKVERPEKIEKPEHRGGGHD